MGLFARLPVGLRRRAYRLAYALLCVYWFVARPRTHGVKCVLTDGDHVLLVRHTYGRHEWELPGGAIKSREEPLSAARREMDEELGVSLERWTDLGEVTGRAQRRHDILHCFHAELPDDPLTLDSGELYTATLFPLTRLPIDLGPYVDPVLSRLNSHRPIP